MRVREGVPLSPEARRARTVLARFRREYGPRRAFLDHETPFQLLVAVLLSARTMDATVNRVTPGLFARHPTPESMARADVRELERLLKGVGFARSKARHLKETARMVAEEHDGDVPLTMEALVRFPGVARKTANVVQGLLGAPPEGIGVDTHVARVSFRLGLTEEKDPARIERDLVALWPRRDWPDVNYLLIRHGRAVCVARGPRCGDCIVEDLCPKKGVLVPGSDPEARAHPTRTGPGGR